MTEVFGIKIIIFFLLLEIIAIMIGVVYIRKHRKRFIYGIIFFCVITGISIYFIKYLGIVSCNYLQADLVDSTDEYCETAFQKACYHADDERVLKYLLEGEDANQIYKGDSMIALVISGAGKEEDKLKTIEYLVRNNADVNWCRTIEDIENSEGKYDGLEDKAVSNLMIAVLYQDVSVTKLLLEYGADVNAQDCWGNTAAMYTALWHQNSEKAIALLDLLVGHGADLNLENSEGENLQKIALDSELISKEYYMHLRYLLNMQEEL